MQTEVAEPNGEIDQARVVLNGGGDGTPFSLSKPTNGFPPRRYRVDLYLGKVEGAGEIIALYCFSVEAAEQKR